ncbi:MAG: hypothetical protein K9G33_10525 [Sneathiella sp.]|nr:hypothetical protein [Sneathiella sp.]
MTALMDDFDDLQLMKVFGARSYYARDDAEVTVLSYDIRPAEKGSFPSLKDDFGWFRGGTVYKRSNDYLFFDSAKIICRPLDVYPGWWGGPADAFDNVTEPVFAYDVPGFDVKAPFKVPFAGAGMPFFGSIDRNVPVISEPHARHISLDLVIPAVKVDGIYRFDAKNKGILLLRRTDGERQPEEVTKVGNRKITVRKAEIEVGDKTITLIDERMQEVSKFWGRYYYYFFDPSVESICNLSIEHIRFQDAR